MNNYHTFLIRSDYVTQLGAHLVAGILALILISSATASPKEEQVAKKPAVVRVAHAALPGTLSLLATTK